MNQPTISRFDYELKESIWGLAERERISLKRAAVELLKKEARLMDGGEA